LNFGILKAAGLFANPNGLIFCDVGDGDCLVVETQGERFPRIAVQLDGGADPNTVAHEIARAIPDSGPVE
jgi:Uma2 family endonuclease